MSKLVTLCSGQSMPQLGLGTWQVRDAQLLYQLIDRALEVGYRFFDTARAYGNERAIGDALQALLPKYGLRREHIFITSKLPPKEQGDALASVAASLAALQTSYLDLYLIHWPGASNMQPDDARHSERRRLSWQQLEQCVDAGQLRSIGVSNYLVSHVDELLSHCRIRPAVNQCEFHPFYADFALVRHCERLGIHFQAYSSLGSPAAGTSLFDESAVKRLSAQHNCTPAQLLLAWPMSYGISVLPRTTKVERVKENFDALNVVLSEEDREQLAALGTRQQKYCWDPTQIV